MSVLINLRMKRQRYRVKKHGNAEIGTKEKKTKRAKEK
jgi:hypothetical protein